MFGVLSDSTPGWSCDAGRHTLRFDMITYRPAELDDVAGMVALIGPEERYRYGFTKLADDELWRFFERRIHPPRYELEMLVAEHEGKVASTAVILQATGSPHTVSFGGWGPVHLPPLSASGCRTFVDLAHGHLGSPSVRLYSHADDSARLEPAVAAGFVDFQMEYPRFPLLDRRRVSWRGVEHAISPADVPPRACPRRW